MGCKGRLWPLFSLDQPLTRVIWLLSRRVKVCEWVCVCVSERGRDRPAETHTPTHSFRGRTIHAAGLWSCCRISPSVGFQPQGHGPCLFCASSEFGRCSLRSYIAGIQIFSTKVTNWGRSVLFQTMSCVPLMVLSLSGGKWAKLLS